MSESKLSPQWVIRTLLDNLDQQASGLCTTASNLFKYGHISREEYTAIDKWLYQNLPPKRHAFLTEDKWCSPLVYSWPCRNMDYRFYWLKSKLKQL